MSDGADVLASLRDRLGLAQPFAAMPPHGAEPTSVSAARFDALTDPKLAPWVHAATNGQTHFFREPSGLCAVIADLAGRNVRRPRVWIAGTSTGEEAYSFLMLALEADLFPDVIATDVDATRLRRASEGRYDTWSVRHVSETRLGSWFERDRGSYSPIARVRERVVFSVHNLAADEPPRPARLGGGFDAILCRNVLIHFERTRIASVVRRLGSVLDESGVLCLSSTESLLGLDVDLEPSVEDGAVVHRRRRAEPSAVLGARVEAPCVAPSGHEDVEAVGNDVLTPNPFLEALGRGHDSLLRHDLDDARREYRNATLAHPVHPEPHFFLGLALVKSGHDAEARDSLRRTTFLAPNLAQAWWLLAGTLDRLGDLPGARRALDALLSIAPRHRVRWASAAYEIELAAASTELLQRLARQRLTSLQHSMR